MLLFPHIPPPSHLYLVFTDPPPPEIYLANEQFIHNMRTNLLVEEKHLRLCHHISSVYNKQVSSLYQTCVSGHSCNNISLSAELVSAVGSLNRRAFFPPNLNVNHLLLSDYILTWEEVEAPLRYPVLTLNR